MAGSGCEALHFDVIAKLTAQRQTRPHEHANHRRTVRDFPNHHMVPEPQLTQPHAVRAVRANVPDTQLFAAFRGREGQFGNNG
ncbi:MAG: hypothetical protein ABIP20_07590 [Chthoniobacteraceae bacterium]